MVAGVGGLYLSYYAGTAAGASIAAMLVAAYLLAGVGAASSRGPERRMSQRGSEPARRPSGVYMPSTHLAASPAPPSPPACSPAPRPDRGAGRRASAIGLRGRTLIVKGTAASDRLALRLRAGAPDKLEVDVGDNGSADFRIARDKVKRIRVKAGGGDDQVRIDDANGAFTDTIATRIDGQGGNDTLRGGRGAERLNGDAGADVSTATAATTAPTSARATTASSGTRATAATPSRAARAPTR